MYTRTELLFTFNYQNPDITNKTRHNCPLTNAIIPLELDVAAFPITSGNRVRPSRSTCKRTVTTSSARLHGFAVGIGYHIL